MYSSIPKNTCPTKHRSDDLNFFTGGYITTTADTDKSLDLPKSVYLTRGNFDEKTFSLRVDLHSKYIDIPLSISQLSEWFTKIGVEDAVEHQYETTLLNLEIPDQKELLNAMLIQCNSRLHEIESAEREKDEREAERERAEREAEREAAIDIGEYDIGQEKGMLNWLNEYCECENCDEVQHDNEYCECENCDEVQYDNEYCEDENSELKCTLTPSTYDHAGECVPSKEKCQYCYKYWCGKCGNGVSNYLVKCCQ